MSFSTVRLSSMPQAREYRSDWLESLVEIMIIGNSSAKLQQTAKRSGLLFWTAPRMSCHPLSSGSNGHSYLLQDALLDGRRLFTNGFDQRHLQTRRLRRSRAA